MSRPKHTVYGGDAESRAVYRDSSELSPEVSLRLRNHSPSGFNWGYGGSGPAQLSIAILLDYYGNDAPELRYYQDFKFRVIASLPGDESWTLTGAEIEYAISQIIRDNSEVA